MNIKKLLILTIIGSLYTAGAWAYKIQLSNETEGDIEISILLGSCKKQVRLLQPGQQDTVDTDICCTGSVNIIGKSGPVEGLQIKNYRPKFGKEEIVVPVFGFLCGNYTVRVQQDPATKKLHIVNGNGKIATQSK
ncbi:MAG TPA: hypothetical protein PLU71_04450 [Candidatus Dependentiae bacterium]|nr:hypothetical protein [Candidatus Dependentiae bacterium]HRQ63083.1 hypothetical protein [Candidatus Dependentiae bacterium]